MKNDKTVKVGISLGDLNGIGSEMVFKSLEDYDILEFCTPVIFANKRLMSFLKKELGIKLHFHGVNEASMILEKKINVVNVWEERVEVNLGEPASEKLSACAHKSLEAAAQALEKGTIDILVSAPREVYGREADEIELEKVLSGNLLSMRINEDFVMGNFQSRPLNPEKPLDKHQFHQEIRSLQKSLLKDFRISHPKIAVLAPCWTENTESEKAKKAEEEIKEIVLKWNDKGSLILGLYDRKPFFETDKCRHFDAIIDFKLNEAEACFGGWPLPHTVNYYAGLKGVVTRPNRGVDYALAGKNKELPDEFRQALYTGIDIHRRREEYKVYAANPLKKYKLKKKK